MTKRTTQSTQQTTDNTKHNTQYNTKHHNRQHKHKHKALHRHTQHCPTAGCLFAEMYTGQPLFPGESDVDQLWHIVRSVGTLPPCFTHCRGRRNGVKVKGMRQPRPDEVRPIDGQRIPQMNGDALQLLQVG